MYEEEHRIELCMQSKKQLFHKDLRWREMSVHLTTLLMGAVGPILCLQYACDGAQTGVSIFFQNDLHAHREAPLRHGERGMGPLHGYLGKSLLSVAASVCLISPRATNGRTPDMAYVHNLLLANKTNTQRVVV